MPKAVIPGFINSEDVLSPRALYESYVGCDMQGVVSLQFLEGINKSLEMQGVNFHNLFWQALTNDYDSLQVQFEAATELVKSINHLIQKQIYETKKKTMEIGKKIVEQLTNKEQPTIKAEIEQVEENIVNDIITND